MKKRIFSLVLLLALSLLAVSCYKEVPPYTPTVPTRLITTEAVQHSGWSTFVSNEGYVVSSTEFDVSLYGAAKYNLVTGTLTPACLLPDCGHDNHTIPSLEGEPCHIPKNCWLHFMQDSKVFLTYSIGELMEETTDRGNVQPVQIFAYYDLATGKHEDLLTVRYGGEQAQLHNTFIAHDYCIFYTRYVAKCEDPTSAEDYALSLCRMKMGEYKEEILFDLSRACSTEHNRLLRPLAIDRDRVFLLAQDTGRILSIALDGTDCRYLLDGTDGVRVNPSASVFYHEGFVYFLSYTDENKQRLYRLSVESGERQQLTDDDIVQLFVCDQGIYYQPDEGQAAPLTIKQMHHDGTQPATLPIRFDNLILAHNTEIWGGGEYLFLPVQDFDAEQERYGDRYTLLYHVSSGAVITLGRNEPVA